MSERMGGPMTVGDLTETYRMEKKSSTLSPVRPDLYPALAALLKSQRDEYDRLLSQDPDSIMAEGANQRRRKSVQLSKEIVEIRMGKICSMALRGAMGADNPVDKLTPEEKEYYNDILEASRVHKGVIGRINNSRKYKTRELVGEPEPIPGPEAGGIAPVPEPGPAPAGRGEGLPPIDESMEFDGDYEGGMPDDGLGMMAPGDPAPRRPTASASDPDYVIIRATRDMPTFAGPDRDYTLRREDVVRMPAVMAEALVNRGAAVKISPSP